MNKASLDKTLITMVGAEVREEIYKSLPKLSRTKLLADLAVTRFRQILNKTFYNNRKCGDCTACCTVMYVQELDKKGDTPCSHLASCGGCAIYDTRPNSCAVFSCLWLLGVTPESWKPNISGIMLDIIPPNRSIHMREVRVGAFDENKELTAEMFLFTYTLASKVKLPFTATSFGTDQNGTIPYIAANSLPAEQIALLNA